MNKVEYLREWRKRNPEKVKKQNARRKDKKTEWVKKRRAEDPEYRKREGKNHVAYHNKRILVDVNYKIRHLLRGRIVNSICSGKRIKKAYKTIELIGCDMDVVRKHLEDKFADGMSWDNHGKWHIDHIIPVASFDLSNPNEQKRAFHYTNLQPLWAKDNFRKSAKIQ